MGKINYLSPWIQTTNRCNLQCNYCFVEKENVDMAPEVYEAIVSQFINFINNGEVEHVGLRLAGGEPLLVFNKWKKPIARFLQNTKEKGRAEILTNLVKIPDEFFDYLPKYSGLNVSVSLDSQVMSKPFPNGKSSSEFVLRNIEQLKKHRNIFIMTVLTENGKYLPDLAEYIIENKFRWEIQLNKFPESNLNKEEVTDNLKKTIDIFNRKKLSLHDKLFFNFCDFTRSDKSCEAGKKLLYINPYGDVYNCQMQDVGRPLTNISKGDLIELLRNNKMERPFLHHCNGCTIEDFCHGDCPVNNNLERREYFCDIMKEYFSYAAKNVLEFGKDEMIKSP